MNETNSNGAVILIKSLISLFSMFVQSIAYTFLLYALMPVKHLGIELESIGGTFIAVAAVTILIPFTFLVDIFVSILYEVFFSRIPLIVVKTIKKASELLILTFIINKIDNIANTISLSIYGEVIFAMAICIVVDFLIRRTQKKSENENIG